LVDAGIIKFIKDSLAKGYSIEKIKQVLLDKGWSDAQVTEAMTETNATQTTMTEAATATETETAPETTSTTTTEAATTTEAGTIATETVTEASFFTSKAFIISSSTIAALVVIGIVTVFLISGTGCDTDNECLSGFICEDDNCIEKEVVYKTPEYDETEKDVECYEDIDCDSGFECYFNKCYVIADQDSGTSTSGDDSGFDSTSGGSSDSSGDTAQGSSLQPPSALSGICSCTEENYVNGLSLADFPYPFVVDGVVADNLRIVIGDGAPGKDTIAVIGVTSALQTWAFDSTFTTAIESEITTPSDHNLILVGNPCGYSSPTEANTLIDTLGISCTDWNYNNGEGTLRLVENGQNVALIISGTTTDDTIRITDILNDLGTYTLCGNSMKISETSTDLEDVTCSVVDDFDQTCTDLLIAGLDDGCVPYTCDTTNDVCFEECDLLIADDYECITPGYTCEDDGTGVGACVDETTQIATTCDDSSCNTGYVCDTINDICFDSCDLLIADDYECVTPGYTCEDDGTGVGACVEEAPIGCTDNSECTTPTQYCKNSVCVECTNNQLGNCATGYGCKATDGTCRTSCTGDTNCDAGYVCDNNGACVEEAPIGCTDNSECTTPTQYCKNSVCVECKNDNHCSGNLICEDDNTCLTQCSGDTHCSGIYVCNTNKNECVECTNNKLDNCDAGYVCDNNGACVEEAPIGCTDNSECTTPTQYCKNSVCVECKNDNHCSGNFICEDDNTCLTQCSGDTHCSGIYVCNTKKMECVECTNNKLDNCDTGYGCKAADGTCRTSCTDDKHCDTGYVCKNKEACVKTQQQGQMQAAPELEQKINILRLLMIHFFHLE
jgi:hypothetical protein